jgi:nicotinamidase-related amidase
VEEFVLDVGRYGGPRAQDLVHPAVLVVDMTNDFAHPGGVYARNGVVCPMFDAIVPPTRAVLEAAAACGVPTILATQVIYADPSGRAVTGGGMVEARPWLAQDGLRPGTWGVQLVDDLPRTDYVVEKPRASAFYATPLEVLLRGLAVETVVVVGCYTNQCVEATVRDAWARDYRVVVVTDAVAAFDPGLHAAALDSLRPLALQLPAAAVVERLRDADAGASRA